MSIILNPWLTFSLVFLGIWLLIWLLKPRLRKEMFWVSLFTMPFGLTEPLFVPIYWNPPSLFDLASKTGFDIESLIFCFTVGGIGAVLYEALDRRILVLRAVFCFLSLHCSPSTNEGSQ